MGFIDGLFNADVYKRQGYDESKQKGSGKA